MEHKVINEHAAVKYQPRPVDMCMCCHGVGVLDFKLQMLEDMCLNTGFYIELGIGNHELRDLGLWGRVCVCVCVCMCALPWCVRVCLSVCISVSISVSFPYLHQSTLAFLVFLSLCD